MARGPGRPPEPHVHWRKFEKYLEGLTAREWLFRGHADLGWDLRPKIGREDVLKTRWEPQTETRLFEEFRRRARQFEPGPGFTAWDWLALAQHYGLPTRLLDWTENPLVAAYFAVASRPYDQNAQVVAVRVTERNYLTLDEELGKGPQPFGEATWPMNLQTPVGVAFVRPPVRASRIISQKGVFSVHASPSIPWGGPSMRLRDRVLKLRPPARFTIPATFKAYFRGRLAKLGVNAAHIRGDLDGLGEALGWTYCNP